MSDVIFPASYVFFPAWDAVFGVFGKAFKL